MITLNLSVAKNVLRVAVGITLTYLILELGRSIHTTPILRYEGKDTTQAIYIR